MIDPNQLLALLLGLQEINIEPTYPSKFKQLARFIEFQSTPNKIQTQIDLILTETPSLKSAYQTMKTELEALASHELAELLPTETEIRAIVPQAESRGGQPGRDEGHDDEITNLCKIVCNHDNPPAASKSLFKRLIARLNINKTESKPKAKNK